MKLAGCSIQLGAGVMFLFVLTVAAVLATSVAGSMYDGSPDVIQLTESSFSSKVLNDNDTIWVVVFYADWCRFSQALAPVYSEAATILKNYARMGAVNSDQNPSFRIGKFPTIKIFGANKYTPEDYSGPRSVQGFTDAVFCEWKTFLIDSPSLYDDSPSVIKLTNVNFQCKVLNDNAIWVVVFYSSLCSSCRNLVPEYAKAAKALKGEAKVGAMNVDENQSFIERYNIEAYPTIKIFSANKDAPETYRGPRTMEAIAEAVMYPNGRVSQSTEFPTSFNPPWNQDFNSRSGRSARPSFVIVALLVLAVTLSPFARLKDN